MVVEDTGFNTCDTLKFTTLAKFRCRIQNWWRHKIAMILELNQRLGIKSLIGDGTFQILQSFTLRADLYAGLNGLADLLCELIEVVVAGHVKRDVIAHWDHES